MLTFPKNRLSFIPLISPATPEARVKLLCEMADSFVYVISRMGVTGAADQQMNGLSRLMDRVRRWSKDLPTAVGFGVSTREHFLAVQDIAKGCVIGSQIISVVGGAPAAMAAEHAEEYLAGITGRRLGRNRHGMLLDAAGDVDKSLSKPKMHLRDDGLPSQASPAPRLSGISPSSGSRFGEFGGQYVPESLLKCLAELEAGFKEARQDPSFWDEYRAQYAYIGRPSSLHLAPRLTEHVGGANIWLKREDLNHTGSHKVNNALGQILLARRLGKTRIIAETGAGQHGVATATICAKFGLKCTIYMGAEDTRRQALNVFRMKLLGAEVVAVETGSCTLRDAVSEALRAWVASIDTTHYVLGSVAGPHPFPTIVRTFQSVIGEEAKQQLHEAIGRQ